MPRMPRNCSKYQTGHVSGSDICLHAKGHVAANAARINHGRFCLCGPYGSGQPIRGSQGQWPPRTAQDPADQWRCRGSAAVRRVKNRNPVGCPLSSPAKPGPQSGAIVRHKERDEIIEIGTKLYEEIIERLPGKIGKKALKGRAEKARHKRRRRPDDGDWHPQDR